MNQDKDNILKLIKWGIILIVAILLTTCGTNLVKDLIKANKPTADTVYTHKTDTIYGPKDTVYKFTPKTVFVYIHDTVFQGPLVSADSLEIYKFFTYRDTIKDANVEIYRNITTQGKTLRYNSTDYKLKVPLRIVDSVKETIKIPTLYPPTFQLGAGLTVGSNIFAPEIGVSYKRHTLSLGYNLTNKQPIAGYKFVLFRK